MKKLLIIFVVCLVTVYVFGQNYFVDTDKGTIQSVYSGKITWVHIPYEYFEGDPPESKWRHNLIRADKILGIKGPNKISTGLVDGDGNSIMATVVTMNTMYGQYPSVYLPDISDGTDWEQNLDWAIAIQRVVDENPGGIVVLSDYLP